MKSLTKLLGKILFTFCIALMLIGACNEFYQIAWGTGVWRGEFSRTWAILYYSFIFLCVAFFSVTSILIWDQNRLTGVIKYAVSFREWLGKTRWLLAALIFIFPAWFFQYTPWGVVFRDIYIRILIWFVTSMVSAFFIKKGRELFGWREILVVVFITSSIFVILVSFMGVTDYPFSLGWSEGNRLWDYSVMFGRDLYIYPADKRIPVLLDSGRQLIGGLPFIFSGISITVERFWVGLTVILPYLLLGFAAFRFTRRDWKTWILMNVWILVFLKQGPIHPPLVLCAAVVALLWRNPLWLAIPLIALTGYAADISRYTWLFAPGLWIGMLELAGAQLSDGKLNRKSWVRTFALGLAGGAGGYFGPKVAGLLTGTASASAAISVEGISEVVSNQPLLWYRLFPNATYGTGILVGLLVATFPLIILLIYLAVSKRWKLNTWQALAIAAPLMAFLVVGLIVSTKIGGGGDLHNMDMFLIGLVFTTVIAWENGGKAWLANIELSPLWIKLILLLLFALPGLQQLKDMRSYDFADDASWLATLTDAPDEASLEMYPSREIAQSALDTIRSQVARAQANGGEVLFMDQRQLLTFGYVTGLPLVPQYEKKVLMNEALSSSAKYFKPYYADLAAKRFSLIVSEPLRTPVKDSSFQFGEENNAWVKWVSIPTLCYYEPKVTLKEVGVQLLVPRADTPDCSSVLPEGSQP